MALWGVVALVPDQLIAPARAVAMFGEELLGAEPVVFLQRGQHVVTTDLIPGDQCLRPSSVMVWPSANCGVDHCPASGWYVPMIWSAISLRF